MIQSPQALVLWSLFALCLIACTDKSTSFDFSIEQTDLKSGFEFINEDSQIEQNDEFLNPGFLWVEKGEALFFEGRQSCSSCHTDPKTEFETAPLTYPKMQNGQLLNIEGRINLCRVQHQRQAALSYESDELLSLTSYVKSQTKGQTITYEISTDLEPHFQRGKEYFFKRRGQLNLSCHQCHDQNWGKRMRGDTVSQGHINGFPTYRNNWQTLGSAHRRFESCDIGVGAEPYSLGSNQYLALEVYLMARGNGLKSETPSLRR